MDLSLIIPLCNEEDNVSELARTLPPILARLAQQYTTEVLLIDDGSTDNTWSLLHDNFGQDSRFILKQHPANRGLGAALKTGFSEARGEVLVTTDSDGTYQFSEIPELVACLDSEADVVTGSPYHPKGSVLGAPASRIFLSRGCSLLYRILLGSEVHTYTSLFRAYRREVIENIPFAAEDFLAGTELLVNAMLQGYRVVEYPCELRARRFGQSKAKVLKTIWAHLGAQFQLLRKRAAFQRV